MVWVLIVAFDEDSNVVLQFARGGMTAAARLFANKLGKPAFDLVGSGCPDWREMDMVVRASDEPCPDQRGFVGGLDVHDDVNIEVGRRLRDDLFEGVKKLGGAMPLVSIANTKARGIIERCA